MKGSVAAMAFGLSALAMANNCNNNCGRQVNGANGKNPDFAARSSMCSAFVSTTVTTTPGATATSSVLFNRNVHGARSAADPVITGTVPAYATSCPDVTAYWSACQCGTFSVTATTITTAAPTSTTTISGPTCTQGLDYNVVHLDQVNNQAVKNLTREVAANLQYWKVPNTFLNASISDASTYPNQGTHSWAFLAQTSDFPDYLAYDFTGYINSEAGGNYTVAFPETADDILAVWVGDAAKNPTGGNAVVKAGYYNTPSIPTTFSLSPGFNALRIIYIQVTGGYGFEIEIVDPNGATILGHSTPPTSKVVAGCVGNGATATRFRPLSYPTSSS